MDKKSSCNARGAGDASESPPVPGGHGAHGEQGLGLPVGGSLSIQGPRGLVFSFLGQMESVKSLTGFRI